MKEKFIETFEKELNDSYSCQQFDAVNFSDFKHPLKYDQQGLIIESSIHDFTLRDLRDDKEIVLYTRPNTDSDSVYLDEDKCVLKIDYKIGFFGPAYYYNLKVYGVVKSIKKSEYYELLKLCLTKYSQLRRQALITQNNQRKEIINARINKIINR